MSSIFKSAGKAIGGLLGGITGEKDTIRAANTAAQAQREAALASVFRPVGMTTRFGQADFGYTDVGGIPRVSSATYQISPELQAIQDQLMGLTGGALNYAQGAQMAAQPLGGAAQGLFGLGSQYLAMSPEQARQQYMNEQYALLDPIRAREEQRLGSSVFGRGRAGLNVGDIGQPELFSLAQARREQDLALAAQAEQAAQQRIGFGSGLFGMGADMLGQQYGLQTQALAPVQGLLGAVGGIEELGQQPFQLGLQVGNAAQAGANTAAGLLTNAAQTQYQGVQQAQANKAQLLSGLAQAGAMAAMSDIRTKENIEKIGVLSNGLNVYKFEYKPEFKDSPLAGHGQFIGVMAQEVEKVIPEAVFETEDGYKAVNYSLIH
jgi:hypothetical protein